MIRINLVQSTAAPSAAAAGITFDTDSGLTPGELQKQGMIRLLLLLAAPLALWAYEGTRIPDLTSRRNEQNNHLQELQTYNVQMEKSVQEIRKFKEDEQKIQTRIAYLDKISKDRLRDIKILDLIQQVIPEKVWLTKLDSGAGKVSIAGMAMSDFDISAFMEALAKSVHFIDVKLVSSAEVIVEGLGVKTFEVICLVERPGA
ncbi:MAG: PilN domain-containing protein [Bdellovibrionaceae bacterium]|nr:PilN domain-containing protein [Pseudobdellovibrionaceae bacterium]